MRRRGFTMVELLVVISIITILASFLVPYLLSMFRNAGITADAQLIANVSAACKNYKQDYGDYPPSAGIFDESFTRTGAVPVSGPNSPEDIKAAGALLLRHLERTNKGSACFIAPKKSVKSEGGLRYLVDHNGKPILYSHCRDYIGPGGVPYNKLLDLSQPASSDNLMLDHRENSNSFQIIAAGLDGVIGGRKGGERDNLTSD